MPDTIVLTLVDGVRIVVPDALDPITPYALTRLVESIRLTGVVDPNEPVKAWGE